MLPFCNDIRAGIAASPQSQDRAAMLDRAIRPRCTVKIGLTTNLDQVKTPAPSVAKLLRIILLGDIYLIKSVVGCANYELVKTCLRSVSLQLRWVHRGF